VGSRDKNKKQRNKNTKTHSERHFPPALKSQNLTRLSLPPVAITSLLFAAATHRASPVVPAAGDMTCTGAGSLRSHN